VNKLLKILRDLRPVQIILSVQIIFSVIMAGILFVSPAYAAKSPPTKGEVQLDQITAKSEEVAASPPMSLNEVVERSKQGINEVQGAADQSKMQQSNDSRPAVFSAIEKAKAKKLGKS
jgi:hypothetical protein